MVETLGVVQVGGRLTEVSSSLGWSALIKRKLGGETLLEWVVRRVSEAQQLDSIVVLVGDATQYAPCQTLAPTNTPVYLGTERDSMGRLSAALSEFGATSMVRVDVNHPFIDPVMIDRLICTARSHPHCDYVGYCTNDGRSALRSHLGVCGEWCRAEAIHRANRKAKSSEERDDPTRYLLSHPELFHLRLVPLPSQLDRNDFRLSLEVEEDWDHAHMIFDALGPESLDWQAIAGLLNNNPEIRERMALLNHPNAAVGSKKSKP